jgi:hypothetical protein
MEATCSSNTGLLSMDCMALYIPEALFITTAVRTLSPMKNMYSLASGSILNF